MESYTEGKLEQLASRMRRDPERCRWGRGQHPQGTAILLDEVGHVQEARELAQRNGEVNEVEILWQVSLLDHQKGVPGEYRNRGTGQEQSRRTPAPRDRGRFEQHDAARSPEHQSEILEPREIRDAEQDPSGEPRPQATPVGDRDEGESRHRPNRPMHDREVRKRLADKDGVQGDQCERKPPQCPAE